MRILDGNGQQTAPNEPYIIVSFTLLTTLHATRSNMSYSRSRQISINQYQLRSISRVENNKFKVEYNYSIICVAGFVFKPNTNFISSSFKEKSEQESLKTSPLYFTHLVTKILFYRLIKFLKKFP